MTHVLKQEDLRSKRSYKENVLMHQLITAVDGILVFMDVDALLAQATYLASSNTAESLAGGAA